MSASDLVGLLLVLFIFGLLLLFLLAFFGYVGYQNWKRNEIRNRILAAAPNSGETLPVRYASNDRYNSFFKIFPWDTAGVIFRSADEFLFLGEQLSGNQVRVSFSPGDARWIGTSPFPNGAVSWFEVTAQGSKHYFSSETGFFIIGSNRSTRAILDSLHGQ